MSSLRSRGRKLSVHTKVKSFIKPKRSKSSPPPQSPTITCDTRSRVNRWFSNINSLPNLYFRKADLTLANLPLMDDSVLVGLNDPDEILLYLHKIPYSSLPSEVLRWIDAIRFPPLYDFNLPFNVDEVQGYISAAPIQYVSNLDALQCVTSAGLIREEATILSLRTSLKIESFNQYVYLHSTKANLYRHADVMNFFITNWTIQSRFLPIRKLLQFIFESSNFPDRGFKIEENPILKILAALYSSYVKFPFIERQAKAEFTQSCSMTLPHLTYALCQLWIQYILNDIHPEELSILAYGYVEKSQEVRLLDVGPYASFDKWLLDFKDYRAASLLFLIQQVREVEAPLFGSERPNGSRTLKNPIDVVSDDMYLKDGYKFVEMCPTYLRLYLRKIGVLTNTTFSTGRVIKDDIEARRLFNVITFGCQHGLYIKNPVILTMRESIMPRGSTSYGSVPRSYMHPPGATYDQYEYESDWGKPGSQCFQQMFDYMLQLLDNNPSYVAAFTHNLEAGYIRALTTRSGGITPDVNSLESLFIDGVKPEVLQALGKKRLLHFIMRQPVYEDIHEWKLEVQRSTSSGERKQVDRRPRIIQMVSNAAQLSAYLLLHLFDNMNNVHEFSSKKNSGTIRDMLYVLSGTADDDVFFECADISGMDASTSKILTQFTNSILIELMKRVEIKKYFWSNEKPWVIRTMQEDGSVSVEIRTLAAPVELIRASERFADTSSFILQERATMGAVKTSAMSFPSGKYSTNAQHSIINSLAINALTKAFNHNRLRQKLFRVRQFSCKVSGDDIVIRFITTDGSIDTAISYSQAVSQWYQNIGLKLTNMLSRYTATFLQQTAVFGKPWPKADRLSIVTSEYGDGASKPIFEGLGEVFDLLRELSQRAAYPHNWVGIACAIGNIARRIRLPKYHVITISAMYENLLQYVNSEFGIYVIYPYITLFIHPTVGIPPPSLDVWNYYPRANSYAPRGDPSGAWIRRVIRKLPIDEMVTADQLERHLFLLNQAHSNLSNSNDLNVIFEELLKSAGDEIKVYGRPDTWYSLPKAHSLGVPWAAYLLSFNMQHTIRRMRVRRIPLLERQKWARVLDGRLDYKARIKSQLAASILRSMRMKPPDEIVFAFSSDERVKQAIETLEAPNEYQYLRQALVEHVNKYTSDKLWLIKDGYFEESRYLFDVLISDSNEDDCAQFRTNDFIFDGITRFMPSSLNSIDRDLIMAKFGYNFGEWSVTHEGYYAFSPGPWKEFNYEALVRFGAELYARSPDNIRLLWDVANIPPRYQETLLRAIHTREFELRAPWQSIHHTRQLFELSKDWNNCADWYKLPMGTFQTDGKSGRIMKIVARDALYWHFEAALFKIYFHMHPLFLIFVSALRKQRLTPQISP